MYLLHNITFESIEWEHNEWPWEGISSAYSMGYKNYWTVESTCVSKRLVEKKLPAGASYHIAGIFRVVQISFW